MSNQSQPVRRNQSFLAAAEQRLIRWLLPRIPTSVNSLDLTVVGMLGSIVATVGLVGCTYSNMFLPAVVLGIAANWFGDSLDGSLARYRKEERPRFGFLVDHTCDLFSQIMVIVAFGFSPFLSLVSALTVLICYLLFSAYTYIRAAAHHIHQMSYIGLGATEFRILMIFWACFGAAIKLDQPTFGPVTTVDVAVLALGAIATVGLGVKAIRDARIVAHEESASFEHESSPRSNAVADDLHSHA